MTVVRVVCTVQIDSPKKQIYKIYEPYKRTYKHIAVVRVVCVAGRFAEEARARDGPHRGAQPTVPNYSHPPNPLCPMNSAAASFHPPLSSIATYLQCRLTPPPSGSTAAATLLPLGSTTTSLRCHFVPPPPPPNSTAAYFRRRSDVSAT